MHPYVYCSILCNGHDRKATEVPVSSVWVKKKWLCARVHTHTHTGILLLGQEKNEVLPFATTWRDLEGIMLSEIRQKNTNAISFAYMGNLKN